MKEWNEFYSRLSACDTIKVTDVGKERSYCRFFRNGIYLDRMFVAEPALLTCLHRIRGRGREIGASGVTRLRNLILGLSPGSSQRHKKP